MSGIEPLPVIFGAGAAVFLLSKVGRPIFDSMAGERRRRALFRRLGAERVADGPEDPYEAFCRANRVPDRIAAEARHFIVTSIARVRDFEPHPDDAFHQTYRLGTGLEPMTVEDVMREVLLRCDLFVPVSTLNAPRPKTVGEMLLVLAGVYRSAGREEQDRRLVRAAPAPAERGLVRPADAGPGGERALLRPADGDREE